LIVDVVIVVVVVSDAKRRSKKRTMLQTTFLVENINPLIVIMVDIMNNDDIQKAYHD
jgi:hypothetical protein